MWLNFYVIAGLPKLHLGRTGAYNRTMQPWLLSVCSAQAVHLDRDALSGLPLDRPVPTIVYLSKPKVG